MHVDVTWSHRPPVHLNPFDRSIRADRTVDGDGHLPGWDARPSMRGPEALEPASFRHEPEETCSTSEG